jgi:GNAT superfamily N-acetyltransferase
MPGDLHREIVKEIMSRLRHPSAMERGVCALTLEIRRAEAGDVEALVRLHHEVHALHLAERPDQFKATNDDEIAGVYRTRLSAASTRVWVAVLDGRAVGHVVAIHHQRAEHAMCPARQWWDVDELGVTAAHRRSGIARALLQTVVDAATTGGIREIELNSWAFNHNAHATFENCGFTPKVIRFELKR